MLANDHRGPIEQVVMLQPFCGVSLRPIRRSMIVFTSLGKGEMEPHSYSFGCRKIRSDVLEAKHPDPDGGENKATAGGGPLLHGLVGMSLL